MPEGEFQGIETKDVSSELFAEMFNYLTYLDSGEEGVIMSFSPQSLPEKLKAQLSEAGLLAIMERTNNDQVLKMLKVYKFGGAQAEAQLQQQARKIVSSYEGEKQLATIPDVTLCLRTNIPDIPANENIYSNLGRFGGAGSELEAIEMEYVPGMNFETYLLRQLVCKDDELQFELGLDDKRFESWDQESWRKFLLDPQIQQKIQFFLKFTRLPEKREPTSWTGVYRENSEKLKARMLHTGAEIDKKILDVLEDTLDVLHSHDFFHNDLHEGQLMVSLDSDGNVDLVFLVDFKDAGKRDETLMPDSVIIGRWGELTATHTERETSRQDKLFSGACAIYADRNTIKLTADKKKIDEPPVRLKAKIEFQKKCNDLLVLVQELERPELDQEKHTEKVKELCQVLVCAGRAAADRIMNERLNDEEGALLLSVYKQSPMVAKELVQMMSVDYWGIMDMDAKKTIATNYGYWQNLQKIMLLPDAEQIVGGQLAKAEAGIEKKIEGNFLKLTLERAATIERRLSSK